MDFTAETVTVSKAPTASGHVANKAYVDTAVAAADNFSCGSSTVADADGNTYATVQLGNQCWMASNLNVGSRVNGSSNQTNNATVEKYCYGDIEANCDARGGLYQWNEAMQYTTTAGAQGICPSGWHIPTDAEQHILEKYVWDGTGDCSASRNSWECESAGTRLKYDGSSDFNALLGGYRATNGSFSNQGTGTDFWSSSESGTNAWRRGLNSSYSTVSRGVNDKAYGNSVCCLQD